MARARYIGKLYHRHDRAVDLFYEYRGHEYMITDAHNGYSETIKEQHAREQARIDRAIEETNAPRESGAFDLDKIWECLGWD